MVLKKVEIEELASIHETDEKLIVIEKSKLQEINEYYSNALSFLQKNDLDAAVKLLHNKMPFELYDISINILFNRNKKSITKEFEEVKQLIKMVDNKLTHFSTKEEELIESEDHFIGDIF